MTGPRARVLLIVALLLAGSARFSAAGPVTYLALGDSLTFGVGADDTPADVSDGDRGYVARFADALAAGNGGVRPQVVNLAVSGETSASFFGEGIGLHGPDAARRNTNYPPAGPLPAQNELLLATLGSIGHDIRAITITLGSNDLFLAAPGLLNPGLSDAEKQALLQTTLAGVGTNLGRLLLELRGARQQGLLAPGAALFVLGTYNPFPAVPGHPFAPQSGPVISALNGVLGNVAGLFGAKYVDIFTPFVGHESEFTFIASSGADFNVHPTAAGYAAIGAQLVPEPSTIAPAVMGGLGLLGYGRRRRQRA